MKAWLHDLWFALRASYWAVAQDVKLADKEMPKSLIAIGLLLVLASPFLFIRYIRGVLSFMRGRANWGERCRDRRVSPKEFVQAALLVGLAHKAGIKIGEDGLLFGAPGTASTEGASNTSLTRVDTQEEAVRITVFDRSDRRAKQREVANARADALRDSTFRWIGKAISIWPVERLDVLRQRRSEAVPRLVEVYAQDATEVAARMSAFVALVEIDERMDFVPLERMLNGEDAASLHDVLDGLLKLESFGPRDAALGAALKAHGRVAERIRHLVQSGTPEVRRKALRVVDAFDLPCDALPFLAAMADVDNPDRVWAAGAVSARWPSAEAFDLTVALCQEPESSQYAWQALSRYSQSPDRGMRKYAAEVAIELLKRAESDRREFSCTYAYHVLPIIVQAAEAEHAPFLLQAAQWQDLQQRWQLVIALDRVLPLNQVAPFQAIPEDSEVRPALVAALLRRAAGPHHDRVWKSIEQIVGRCEGREAFEVARSLASDAGHKARSLQTRLADKCTGFLRMELLCQQDGVGLQEIWQQLGKLGLAPLAEYAEMGKRFQTDYPSRSPHIEDMLLRANASHSAESSQDEYPLPYETELASFAKLARGALVPEDITVEWHSEDEESIEGDYTLAFAVGQRVYEFNARDQREYFDLEAAAMAYNVALADLESPLRFGLCGGVWMCGAPPAFAWAKRQLHFPEFVSAEINLKNISRS